MLDVIMPHVTRAPADHTGVIQSWSIMHGLLNTNKIYTNTYGNALYHVSHVFKALQ